MKKVFIYSLVLSTLVAIPSIAAATLPQEAEQIPPPVEESQASTASTSSDSSVFDIDTLKDQPLSMRRIAVAFQLEQIHLKLSVLYDKTKFAANRLAQNGIDVSAADSSFALGAAALAEAKPAIENLVLLANDPVNQSALTLMVGDLSFKDAVIAAETKLRDARDAIIAALGALKAAVVPIQTSVE